MHSKNKFVLPSDLTRQFFLFINLRFIFMMISFGCHSSGAVAELLLTLFYKYGRTGLQEEIDKMQGKRQFVPKLFYDLSLCSRGLEKSPGKPNIMILKITFRWVACFFPTIVGKKHVHNLFVG
jgi:hypothetical protein